MKLYHFACRHSAEGIRSSGFLRPWPQPVLGGVELVWLTDLDDPTRGQVGLTSHTLKCDRMEYRVLAESDGSVRWTSFARSLPLESRRALELSTDAAPAHWWISLTSVPVLAVEPEGY